MRRFWLTVWALGLLLITGCWRHTHKIVQPALAGPVMSATVLDLVAGINQRYDSINSLNATVEFAASQGGVRHGERTDYTPIQGYILFRKPQMLRVLGLVPLLHTRAFDLASNGSTFTLLIPPKNLAIEGNTKSPTKSKNALENLRPDIFLDSLLVHSISPESIVALIHESTTYQNPKSRKKLIELPEYDLTVLRRADTEEGSTLAKVADPLRVIRISRTDLLPVEMDIYNSTGNLETQVIYGPYRSFDGTEFPSTISIHRPIDEFSVTLSMQKVRINQTLADDQFEIKLPNGVKIQHLAPATTPAAIPAAAPSTNR